MEWPQVMDMTAQEDNFTEEMRALLVKVKDMGWPAPSQVGLCIPEDADEKVYAPKKGDKDASGRKVAPWNETPAVRWDDVKLIFVCEPSPLLERVLRNFGWMVCTRRDAQSDIRLRDLTDLWEEEDLPAATKPEAAPAPVESPAAEPEPSLSGRVLILTGVAEDPRHVKSRQNEQAVKRFRSNRFLRTGYSHMGLDGLSLTNDLPQAGAEVQEAEFYLLPEGYSIDTLAEVEGREQVYRGILHASALQCPVRLEVVAHGLAYVTAFEEGSEVAEMPLVYSLLAPGLKRDEVEIKGKMVPYASLTKKERAKLGKARRKEIVRLTEGEYVICYKV